MDHIYRAIASTPVAKGKEVESIRALLRFLRLVHLSSQGQRASHWRATLTLYLGALIAALLCSACASGVVAQTRTPTVTATLAAPTATSRPGCGPVGVDPGTAITPTFPLPPGTISERLPSAAGAGFLLECTPNATQASISAYLNKALSQAGWHKWNPQVDDAYGCGAQANDYWQWATSQQAIGWDFRDTALPLWHITVCSRGYGAS